MHCHLSQSWVTDSPRSMSHMVTVLSFRHSEMDFHALDFHSICYGAEGGDF